MPPSKSTSPDEDAPRFPARVWAAGDGNLQIPLAGLLADDPTLNDAELTDPQWRAALDEYLSSPRP